MHQSFKFFYRKSFIDPLIQFICVNDMEGPKGLLAKLQQATTVDDY